MIFEPLDIQWDNSTVSKPLNIRGSFQYVLITSVQFDCYVHLGSSPGEIYGELLKGDIGSIRLPSDRADSIVLEAVNPNPDPNSGGVYTGIYAQLYVSDMPLRFEVAHRRPPIFSEQNRDSTDGSDSSKRPLVYISDDSPVVVAAMGLTSSYTGEVITDHETNRYTSRWGSMGQSFLRNYNVGAVGLYGMDISGAIYRIPTDSVAGLSVNVTAMPAIAFASPQSVNVINTPTVNIASIAAPTLRRKSYVAGFRAFGAGVSEISTAVGVGQTILGSITHDATATKNLKLQNVKFAFYSVSAGAEITIELRKVNTNPTGGTSLVTQKTAANYSDPFSFDAESTAMLMPTGIAIANSIAYDFVSFVTTALITTTGPVPWQDVYNISNGWGESPNIAAGQAGGWAIVCQSSAAVTLKWTALVRFTEE